ncbi:Ribosomal protein L24 [mine drainage metagenome]|uniref:Ribosomal protein L24 n=1 Tax=mine drainage metagenome TaxID=410659 RepID=T1BZZ2_9ZZZZ
MVISGRDRGRRGIVLRVDGDRVWVEGVHMVNKHLKPNPNTQTQGGIVEREASMHISNVMIYNPVEKKPGRVGFRKLADGRKVRVFRSTGESVDV